MSVAAGPLFAFDNTFVRELEGLYEPWQAADGARSRGCWCSTRTLAAELGADPDALRAADGVAVLVGNAVPDGRLAGRPGVRRPPVRRVLAAPRRRAGAAARRGARRPRPPARPAPEGLGPHAVRARRRRQGGRRADAARVRDRRGDARARHPDDPGAGRRRDRRGRRARDGAARRGARPGRGEPPARRHVPVRRRARRRRRCCGASPTTRSPATTPRRPRPSNPYLALLRARRRRPGRRWSPAGCSSGSSTA